MKTNDERRDGTVAVRMTLKTFEKLREMAAQEERTVSTIVRRLIDAQLQSA